MKTIEYTLNFFSDWHCGSGLAAGADVDVLVIKDKDKLPYIPGKTLKGLIREAVVDILYFSCDKLDSSVAKGKWDAFLKTFGYVGENGKVEKGSCFFENATIANEITNKIIIYNAQKYLYRVQASTAIDENGVADGHSLRMIETVIPCELKGCIFDVQDDIYDDMKRALGMIKRVGMNRNRGLGRCQFNIKEVEEGTI